MTHPQFREGSLIVMKLDLREESGGRLTAFVGGDSEDEVHLFEGMLSGAGSGFLPAVSLCNPGSVQMLHLESYNN